MMPFQRYRDKPRFIEAVQWDGTIEHAHAIQRRFDELKLDLELKYVEPLNHSLKTPTLELDFSFLAKPGDWIALLPSFQGELSPYRYTDEDFREIYTTPI